jgi:5-carboxymethyl-2-hydroxymuconate isomerase
VSIQNEVPVTTTETSHLDAADALIDDIRALKQRVPNFVVPESKRARREIAAAASLPAQFVDLAALAVRNHEELTRGGNFGLAQIRDRMSYADAYGPVADELEAMALFVRHSVRMAQNEAGSSALTTYALAKRLAKRPESAALAPHVEDMRIALGARGKGRSKKPAPKPASGTSSASTQPPPVTTSSPATVPPKQ